MDRKNKSNYQPIHTWIDGFKMERRYGNIFEATSGVGGSFVGENFQNHGIRYPKIVLGKSYNVIKNSKKVRTNYFKTPSCIHPKLH